MQEIGLPDSAGNGLIIRRTAMPREFSIEEGELTLVAELVEVLPGA